MKVQADPDGTGRWDATGLLVHWQRRRSDGAWRALVRISDRPGIARQRWLPADRVRPHPDEQQMPSRPVPTSTVASFGPGGQGPGRPVRPEPTIGR